MHCIGSPARVSCGQSSYFLAATLPSEHCALSQRGLKSTFAMRTIPSSFEREHSSKHTPSLFRGSRSSGIFGTFRPVTSFVRLFVYPLTPVCSLLPDRSSPEGVLASLWVSTVWKACLPHPRPAHVTEESLP